MEKDKVIEIKQEEALKAVKDVKGSKIHCFLGFIGADWDKKSVIALIKKSKRIAWVDNMFNHNLAVINDGRLHNFDIQYPSNQPPQLNLLRWIKKPIQALNGKEEEKVC